MKCLRPLFVHNYFPLFDHSYIDIYTRALETDKIKTVTGKDTWHPGVIEKMLSNEKYMGDALLQKTYTVDFLTKKRVKMRELYLSTI
ncbi:recombinase family protein [Tissierella sp.]|uniref:recombinase family protein n=1 Tax=Tissierella sp. TaxID=41274 RepID=UPI0037DCA9CF